MMFPLFELLPQPTPIPIVQTRITIPSMARQLRRRDGMLKKRMQARAAPPPERKRVKRLVLTGTLPVEAPKLKEPGLTVQVTPDAAVQVKFTAPLKPFTEERLMVSVPELPMVTGTTVVCGTMEKSESGLEIALPLFKVVADGA